MSVLDEKFTNYVDTKLLKKALNDSVIITVTDSNGIITYVNQHFIDISGYAENEIVGSSHSMIKHPDTDIDIFEDIWRTIKSNKIWKGTIKNRKKDGSSYWVKTLIMPIIRNDKIDGYISIRTDITEFVKIKESQKNFNHRVMHELHNKLSTIKLSIDWIGSLNDFEDKNDQEYLKETNKALSTMRTAYTHLERLVHDIGDISKIDMHSIRLQMDWISIDDIVDDLVASIDDLVKKNNNTFILKNNTPKKTLIYLDDLRINQILINIISNASKFTENGTITLSIDIKDDDLVFSVQDNGKGIDENMKEYIFDEYWKGPLSQGFGLGLAISKGLSEYMDGKIWFKSDSSGSTFYVSFKKFRMTDG